jgi:hypothetical protein
MILIASILLNIVINNNYVYSIIMTYTNKITRNQYQQLKSIFVLGV